MTEASVKALAVLRDSSQFQWYVIPLFVIVLYVYAVEVERKNWNVFLGGLAFYGMDIFNEIWNALILRGTGRSAFWTTPGQSAYVILIGLNIEITFMFAILGIAAVKVLPPDKKMKIMGIPNRWLFAVTGSILAVIIEVILNRIGALVWEYSFWNWPNVFLIFLIGYLTFFAAAYWVHDMEKMRNKLAVLGVIYGVDLAGIIVFGVILRWI